MQSSSPSAAVPAWARPTAAPQSGKSSADEARHLHWPGIGTTVLYGRVIILSSLLHILAGKPLLQSRLIILLIIITPNTFMWKNWAKDDRIIFPLERK
jgi:hypothetical protein